MKIARFLFKDKKYWGCVEGDYIRFIEGNPFREIQLGKRKVPLKDVKLLAPVRPIRSYWWD